MSRRNREFYLPDWLWYFLALPAGLALVLLYRQRRHIPLLRRLAEQASQNHPRYQEPDSIPLDMHSAAVPYYEPSLETDRDTAEVAQRSEDIDMEMMASEYGTAQPGSAAIAGGATSAEEAGATQMPHEQATPDQPDDLKAIEGIGPSIAGILNSQDIMTFRQLANTPVERLVEILQAARLSHLANPETWPEQARLASESKWDELIALQRTLKAGRRMNQE